MPEIAAKAVVYAAALILVGVVATRLVLARRAGMADRVTAGALAPVARVAWIALLAALAFRAWAHTAAVVGLADSVAFESLKTIAIDSRWGGTWRWQTAAALVGAAAEWTLRSRLGGLVGAGVTLGLVVAIARGGHTEAIPARVLLHATHVVAGGIWLGTLAVVAAVSRRRDADRGRLLQAFSMLAMVGAAALALTGALAAYTYVGAVSNLWATGYGRTLVVKLVFVTGALGCGFVNWRSLRAPAASCSAPAVGWELWCAAAIVIATAVLTELGHP